MKKRKQPKKEVIQQELIKEQKEEANQQEPVDADQLKGEQQDQNKKKTRHYQLYWIIGTILFLVIVYFISNYIFSQLSTVEYEGITFTKEKFGDIPVFHYYYYITPELKYNLYLRNNPKKNAIPITGNAVDTGIEFFRNDIIYLSVNPEGLTECEYGRVGIGTLASFLADNQFTVKGAAPNKILAEEANAVYATCSTNPRDPVIMLQAADKTEIIRDSRNCYKINIANCEILEAIEKFEVQMILDAKERREGESQ